MSTIAMPKYTRQAAQQTAEKNTSRDMSLTSQAAEQALGALNKSYQNQTTAVRSVPASGSGSGNVMTKPRVTATQTVPAADGMKGIRATLNNYGIDNVGWNDEDKTVTIDGKNYYKPSTIIDGTSYAGDKDMYNIINSVYKDKGTSIEGVTNYIANTGISSAVKWSGGKLTVGGRNVPVAYVDEDGTAYADKNLLDEAISAYKESAGITGNQEVYNNWYGKYGDRIENALRDIENREKWSYDIESDPAYQAYRDAYIREGNRAYQNAYAQIAANTGGYGSSMANTAAGQQMNYYMQQLNDRVPELMQDSYNRYLGEQELNRAALESIISAADTDYNKAYQANHDSVNDSNTANYYNYLRDIDARDYNRQVETEDRLWNYDKDLYADKVAQSRYDTDRYEESADLDLQAKRISNQISALQSIIYRYSGNLDSPISDADAMTAGIAKKADGTYPTAREIQEAYSRLMAAADYIGWTDNGLKQTLDTWKINNGLYGG